MAKLDRETPPLILVRTSHGLSAWADFDAEVLDQIPMGTQVEVPKMHLRLSRSVRQLRLYWKALGRVVENVEGYPTAKKLHNTVKLELGYVERVRRLDGTIEYIPDSTALNKMTDAEYQIYFDQVMKLLAETFGFDPLAAIEERAA